LPTQAATAAVFASANLPLTRLVPRSDLQGVAAVRRRKGAETG